MAKITIAPFNRVEGDLKIKVELKDGKIFDAQASGVMFRGFEYILKGRFPEDALVYTPRICGICSISHSVASSNALAAISEDFTPSRSGQHAKNISHATENAMSHITQFYLYFAPDLLNKKYAGLKYYPFIKKRLTALKGESVKTIMTERKRFLEILGLIGGKWPHTLALQPGGITKALTTSEIFRIKGVIKHFTTVMETVLLGMPVKSYLQIKSINNFESALMEASASASDMAFFYHFSK
ncbi:MAG: nickel-dependent hydrogenase large subunit, partial [Nitrospinae bacterium]|nr:nickel-dependent hydrogenase large subunit [Nitrospinota bacterium]